MKVIHSRDKFYLKENRKEQPKEYFKFILQQSKQYIETLQTPSLKILDVGCATGEFLYYFKSVYPQIQSTGLDIMPELLENAKRENPNSDFICGDISKKDTLPKSKFDIVYMLGVHSIFDDYEPVFDNFIDLIKNDGGRGYIFNFFNPEDLDVLVKVRESGDTGSWQAVYCNIISKTTIANYLKRKNLKHVFTDWEISIDLPKNQSDPLRAWTIRMDDGSRMIVNGIQMMQNFSLLEIQL